MLFTWNHDDDRKRRNRNRKIIDHLKLWKLRSSNFHIFLYFCIFIIISYVYKILLYKHGTLSAPAVYLFTKPFNGLRSTDYPENGWKPPFRIVVSLTTTPSRLNKLQDTLNSLLTQSLLPDTIYINIPKGKMKRHPERSYDDTELPDFLTKTASNIIKINRCIDFGPSTKLIGALLEEKNATTLIITLDDDFIYPKRLVESLVWESYHKKEDAVGICGWGTMTVPGSIGIVPVYVPYIMRPNGRYVDILQACCGNAYRRGFFTQIDILMDAPDICITVDDIWIAAVLYMVEKRKSAIISKRLDPDDVPWKIEEAKIMSDKKLKLSQYNDENEIHYKCILALEEKFNMKWNTGKF